MSEILIPTVTKPYLCRGCKICAEKCPAKAITFKRQIFNLSETRCVQYIRESDDGECWKCNLACINNAIQFVVYQTDGT